MSANKANDCITVVLHLPDSAALRKKITTDLGLGKQFHGAFITAMSLEDEISRMEFLEGICNADDIKAASQHAAQIHKKFVPQ